MTDHAPQPAAPDDDEQHDEPATAVAERPAVEIVEAPTTGAEVVHLREPSALERAATELMDTPGAPGRDEFLVLATTARLLSMSRGAPKAVRNDPWLAFHLALIGRDLAISPSSAIAQVDVIGEGDDAQLSLSPELMNAQIARLGLGRILKVASSAEACTAVAVAPGGRIDVRCARTWPEHVESETRPCACTFDRILGEVEFTWADAQQARLADSACQSPTEHTAICMSGGNGSRGKRCHQGYRTYPKRMMWWRAAGWCQSDYFPEASLGLYSPEELGAVVDPETGRPYDPATVALPEGFDPPEAPHDPSMDPLCDVEPDVCADLRARIDRLSAFAGPKAALREMWTAPTGQDGDGPPALPPFARLLRRHMAKAVAMVRSVEQRVQRGEWGDDDREAWIAASTAAADAAKGDDEPDGGAAAPTAPESAPDGDGAAVEPDAAESAESAPDDDVVAEYERQVATPTETEREQAEARRRRAQQIARESGLAVPPDLDHEDASEPVAEPEAPQVETPDEAATRLIAEVKALSPTEVREQLVALDLNDEAGLNPAGQRKALAERMFSDWQAAHTGDAPQA